MRSAQICAVSRNCLPLAALPPVSSQLNPILIGSAAVAGKAAASSSAAQASALIDISSSLPCVSPPRFRGFIDRLPEARDKAAPIDRDRLADRSRLCPVAAPAKDRVVPGDVHRDEIRSRILGAPCIRLRQIASRIRLAARQVGAQIADQNPPLVP